MPNVGHKKHIRPKKERVNALEFATGFLISCSSSADSRQESIDRAVVNAKSLAEGARKRILDDEKASKDEQRLSKEDVFELRDTANFWDNIAGHIPKVKFK